MNNISRQSGISGTEVAGLFGLSPYCTPFSIYTRKKGLVPDLEQTERMRFGKLLEPVVVQAFEQDTGLKVDWQDKLIAHPKEPLIIGTPDGFIGEDSGFEAKTAGLDRAADWGDEGSDFIPRHYLMQAQYYSMLTGRPTWHVAALIAGSDFRCYKLTADEELQAAMLDEVRRFWKDHIEPGIPPEIDATSEAKQYLMQRYKEPTEGVREATSAEEELIVGILQSRKELKFLEQRKDELSNKLRDSMGFFKGLTSQAGKASWTSLPPVTVASFERKASQRLTVTGRRGEAE